jgi:membrane-associated phospholipid phosphatase
MLARLYRLVIVAIVLCLLPQQVWCGDRFATQASNSIGPLLVVGELSLLTDGKAAKPEMIQGAKALAATGVFTELLKATVREKRPNGNSLTSFPSGHTSAAFAMATVVSDYKPGYKWLAYGAASAVGWSRVEVGAHRWQDVVAGAALGYFTAKHFTRQHVNLSPGRVGLKWVW